MQRSKSHHFAAHETDQQHSRLTGMGRGRGEAGEAEEVGGEQGSSDGLYEPKNKVRMY
jgi:hypothetical protein